MKFFVGILTCRKNLPKIDYLRKTWIKDLISNNITYKVFIGKNNDITTHDDIVVLDVEDDYEHLKDKTKEMIKYAISYEQFDYILKTDDDTFVDVNNFLNLNLSNKDYIGWFSCLKTFKRLLPNYIDYMKKRNLRKNFDHSFLDKLDKNLTYAIGGFYLLSKNIASKVLNELESNELCKEILQEDISMGYACSKINVSSLDLYSKHNWYQISLDNIFYHPINFMLMSQLYSNKDTSKREQILEQNLILNNNFRYRLQ